MKFNLYKALLLVLFSLTTLSCKKDSEPAPPSIVGTWTYVTRTTVHTYQASGNNPSGTSTKTETYTPDGLKVTFEADGSTVTKFNGVTNDTGTYTYVGNLLTRGTGPSIPGLGYIYTVTSLTSNTLVMNVTDVDSYGSYFRTFNLTR